MIKPAVEGTLRALKAAKKAGVKKVVLTSSTVAMASDKKKNHLNQNSWTNPKTDKVSALIDKTGKFQFVSSADKNLKYHTKGFRVIEAMTVEGIGNDAKSVSGMYYADENNYNIFESFAHGA